MPTEPLNDFLGVPIAASRAGLFLAYLFDLSYRIRCGCLSLGRFVPVPKRCSSSRLVPFRSSAGVRSALLALGIVVGGLLGACAEPITEYFASDARFATMAGRKAGAQISSTAQAGYLVYGPYVELAAGSYRLVARGTLTGAAGVPLPLGVLDVAGYKGTRIYVSRPLYGDEQAGEGNIAAVFFDLPKAVTDVEFRIQVTAAASAVFRGYDLSKVSSFP